MEQVENIAAALQKKIDECENNINYFRNLMLWDKVNEWTIRKDTFKHAKIIATTQF